MSSCYSQFLIPKQYGISRIIVVYLIVGGDTYRKVPGRIWRAASSDVQSLQRLLHPAFSHPRKILIQGYPANDKGSVSCTKLIDKTKAINGGVDIWIAKNTLDISPKGHILVVEHI